MAGVWFGSTAYAQEASAREAQAQLPLDQREVGWFDPTRVDPSPGRRLRSFATMVRPLEGNINAITKQGSREAYISPRRRLTYGEALHAIEACSRLRDAKEEFSAIPLRVGECRELVRAVPEAYQRTPRDPDLHPALQDLGDEINEDIREALFALDDPDHYYPGVDDGIEPVTDDHVKLVIWAMQRELDRELRPAEGQAGMLTSLPAAPLMELPWHIQRALAERRRLRFKQWGIGRQQWEQGTWSLWEVPCDADYVSRRAARLNAA
ncbi:MAG: hypothetical protein C0506_14800 [Anaerolinea sp.]|nr:hypothetical protein [Anaerolinea sp.]